MAGKLNGILKILASNHSSEWKSKGTLLFRIPVGNILRGIYLDNAPSGCCYVQCVIIPLHMPTNRIYSIDGPQIGFRGESRLATLTGNKLWETREDYLIGLEDVLIKQLRPEWNRLTQVQECINYFASLNGYVYKHGRREFRCLIYLTAYQHDYERCMHLIQEYKQLFPENNPMRLHVDSYPQANWQRLDLIEECIKTENFPLLDQKLQVWYDYSIEALGLTKFV